MIMTPDHEAQWAFAIDPRAPAQARRQLGEYAAARHPDLPADAWDTVLLLLSELVTNAVQHGEGRVHVRVLDAAGCFRVEVSDTGAGAPVTRPVDLQATA